MGEYQNERALVEPVDEPLWSENFALAMADAEAGIAMLLSIGTWFGDPTVWREKLAVAMPDGRRLVARNYGRNTSRDLISAALARYEIVEHGRRVSFRFDGPVMDYTFDELMSVGAVGKAAVRATIALDFAGTAPIWKMHGDGAPDATGIMGALHDEQLGICQGSILVNGMRHEIRRSHACRDHSRGPRDMRRFKAHAWINGQFDDGRGFQLYHAHVQGLEAPALAKAVIAVDGELYPAAVEGVTYIDAPDQFGRTHNFRLIGEKHRMDVRVTKVIGSVVTGVLRPFEAFPGVLPGREHVTIFDEAVVLESDGVRGVGICERGVAPPGWAQ